MNRSNALWSGSRSRVTVCIPLALSVLIGASCSSTTSVDELLSFEVISTGIAGPGSEEQIESTPSNSNLVVEGEAFAKCGVRTVEGELDRHGERSFTLRISWVEDLCVTDAPKSFRYRAKIGPLESGTYDLEVRQPVLVEGHTWRETSTHTAMHRVP